MVNIKNINQLKILLQKYGINTTKWGSNGTKSINKLYKEIVNNDSVIKESNGELMRETKSVWMNVSRSNDSSKVLRERIHANQNGKLIKTIMIE